MRLSTIRIWLGRLANWIGFPGVVVDVDYKSAIFGTSVKVRRSPLYTVITVDGIDVYFYRFSGEIDGIGFSRDAGYKQDEAQESIDSASGLAARLRRSHSRTS